VRATPENLFPELGWIAPSRDPSKKVLRDRENDRTLGGQRNPRAALARLPGLAAVGRRVRQVFLAFLGKHREEVLRPAREFGSEAATEPDPDLVAEFREMMASELQAGPDLRPPLAGVAPGKPGLGKQSDLQPHLVGTWLKSAGDPEKSTKDWIVRGVPLGIEVEIPVYGTCPLADYPEGEDFSLPSCFEQLDSGIENYRSFKEFPEDADIEVTRVLEQRFAAEVPIEDLPESFKDGTISRMSILLKERLNVASGDLEVKLRLIVDMLRSGGNSRSRVPERPILPRLWDAVVMFLHFLFLAIEQNPPIEAFTMDFSDAYFHFRIRQEEWKHMLSPWSDLTVLIWVHMAFGLTAAPLLWSRFAGALARMLVGLYSDLEMGLQLYLDDPLLLLIGAAEQRLELLALFLWVLVALGVKVAWHKSTRSGEDEGSVTWIGVTFTLMRARRAVSAQINQKMVGELTRESSRMRDAQVVTLRSLRTFAGRLSWAATILPRIRWVVNILFAVLASAEKEARAAKGAAKGGGSKGSRAARRGLVHTSRMRLALFWISAFWASSSPQSAPVTRMFYLDPRPEDLTVVTDASPWGLGAGLFKDGNTMLKCAALEISADTARELGASLGDAASQTIFELLAILWALQLWRRFFQDRSRVPKIRADSAGALGAVANLASRIPALNFLAAEISLRLERYDFLEIRGAHIPGSINKITDYASRLAAPEENRAPRPAALEGVHLTLRRKEVIFVLPGPGRRPELWGRTQEQEGESPAVPRVESFSESGRFQ